MGQWQEQWAPGQWALRENNALELANQSASHINYKMISYHIMLFNYCMAEISGRTNPWEQVLLRVQSFSKLYE